MIEERLRTKERLFQIQAAERNKDPNLHDDLIQEARIRAWQIMANEPDKSDAYIHTASGRHISSVAQRGNWTGKPNKRDRGSREPLDTGRDSIDDPEWEVQIEAADALEAVEWAYHHGEIQQALRSLPERHREYVVMRFWGGMTNAEIAAHQEVRLGNVARTWNEAIRPKLAEQLTHLADTALV